MRPTKIPDDIMWPGARKVDIGVTTSQRLQGIGGVEGVIDTIHQGSAIDGTPRTQIRIEVEPKDLEALQNNPHIWLAFIGVAGGIYPFSMTVEDRAGSPSESIELQDKLRQLIDRLRDETLSDHFKLTDDVRKAHASIAGILEGILEDTAGKDVTRDVDPPLIHDHHETRNHPVGPPPDPSSN